MFGLYHETVWQVHKTIYYSLIRCHLKNCYVVWSPHHRIQIQNTETVKSRFVFLLLYRMNIDNSTSTYNERLENCGRKSLEVRRTKLILSFGHQILIGEVHSSELLRRLNFKIPKHTKMMCFYRFMVALILGNTVTNRIKQSFNNIFFTSEFNLVDSSISKQSVYNIWYTTFTKKEIIIWENY